MIYRILAEATMFVHFAYLVFVVVGGLMALRWGWILLLHAPAFVWGGVMSLMGWICPLTPLENRFRRLAGEEGYDTGFIEHYIVSILYPPGLTRTHQIALGLGLLLLNGIVYAYLARRRFTRKGRAEA
jgi:hypothetical protein